MAAVLARAAMPVGRGAPGRAPCRTLSYTVRMAFVGTRLACASERDPSVSLKNPAQEEAQKHLELGTSALEVGDLPKAMVRTGTYPGRVPQEFGSARECIGVLQPGRVPVPRKYVRLLTAEDLEGAISAWKEALRIAPDSPDAHTNLASAYVMSKPSRPDLAVEHLK